MCLCMYILHRSILRRGCRQESCARARSRARRGCSQDETGSPSTQNDLTYTHDQSIRRLRCDGQTRRECVDSSDKRVVSNSKKLVWNLAEDTECIVVDGRGLPMHDLPTHCDCALHTPRRSPDGQDTQRGLESVQQIVGSHPHWHLPHSVLLVLVISQCV